MERKQSELTVITKAKDLCSYVMTVTQKSPKHFRYTFVNKLQNLALSVIENLFRANGRVCFKSGYSGSKGTTRFSTSRYDGSETARIYGNAFYGTGMYSS